MLIGTFRFEKKSQFFWNGFPNGYCFLFAENLITLLPFHISSESLVNSVIFPNIEGNTEHSTSGLPVQFFNGFNQVKDTSQKIPEIQR